MHRIVLAIVLVSSISIAQLNLKIDSDKNEYAYGEKIQITCTVENNSDSTVTFFASNYQSCQAEFILNEFDSHVWGTCLPSVEELTFPPFSKIQYLWTVDPYILGLPDIEGTQQLIGYFRPGWNTFNVSHLRDTTTFTAPLFLGGQLILRFNSDLQNKVDSIRNDQNYNLLESEKDEFHNITHETWQILDVHIDSAKTYLEKTSLFSSVEYNRMITYDRIFKQNSLSQFYPLQIGNKWLYKNLFYDIGTEPDITYFYKEVVDDTVMENGKYYFTIEERGRIYFERFDTVSNQIIRYDDTDCNKKDNPIYSLNYVPKDTVEWIYCDQVPYNITYNEARGPDSAMIEFEKDFLVIENTGFRKHLGLFYRSYLEISKSTSVLIGAEIDGKVWGTLTDIYDKEEQEYKFTLDQNYPNPFNPTTSIEYQVSSIGNVTLKVYDVLGREISTIVNEVKHPGTHEVTFDASNLPSGVYFYRLTNGNYSATKKMLLMK